MIDACPPDAPSGIDRSSVDRLPQYSDKCKDKDAKSLLKGSSWLRACEDGPRAYLEAAEVDIAEQCLTKRVGREF